MKTKTKKNIAVILALFGGLFLYTGYKTAMNVKQEYTQTLNNASTKLKKELNREIESYKKLLSIIYTDINHSSKESESISATLNQLRLTSDNTPILGHFNNFTVFWIAKDLKSFYTALGNMNFPSLDLNTADLAKQIPDNLYFYLIEGNSSPANKSLNLVLKGKSSAGYIAYNIDIDQIGKSIAKVLNNDAIEVFFKDKQTLIYGADSRHNNHLNSLKQHFTPNEQTFKAGLPFDIYLYMNPAHYYSALIAKLLNSFISLLLYIVTAVLVVYIAYRSVIALALGDNQEYRKRVKELENKITHLDVQKSNLETLVSNWQIEEKEKKAFLAEVNQLSYASLLNIIQPSLDNNLTKDSADTNTYAHINLQETLILSSQGTNAATELINIDETMSQIKRIFAKLCQLKNCQIIESLNVEKIIMSNLNVTYFKLILFYFIDRSIKGLPPNKGRIEVNIDQKKKTRVQQLHIKISDNGYVNRKEFIKDLERLGETKQSSPNLFAQLDFNEEFILKLIKILDGDCNIEHSNEGINVTSITIRIDGNTADKNIKTSNKEVSSNNVISLFPRKNST